MIYHCPWCGKKHGNFAAVKAHVEHCERLSALGLDLETEVRAGRMTIEDAEATRAARPRIRL